MQHVCGRSEAEVQQHTEVDFSEPRPGKVSTGLIPRRRQCGAGGVVEGFDEGQVDAGCLVGAIGVLSPEFLAVFGQVRQSTAEHQGALVLADQRVEPPTIQHSSCTSNVTSSPLSVASGPRLVSMNTPTEQKQPSCSSLVRASCVRVMTSSSVAASKMAARWPCQCAPGSF